MVKAELVDVTMWECKKCCQHYNTSDDGDKCCSECPKFLKHDWDENVSPWQCRNCGVKRKKGE